VSRTWLKVSAKGNAKNWHAFECCRSLGSGWGCGRWVVAGGQVLARWTWQRNANVASTAFLLPGTKTRFLMPALKMAKHLAKKQKEIKEKSLVFLGTMAKILFNGYKSNCILPLCYSLPK